MNIERISHYNVSTTKEEDKTIDEMLAILYEIRDEMTKKDCFTLEMNDGTQISKSGIEHMIDALDILHYVNIML